MASEPDSSAAGPNTVTFHDESGRLVKRFLAADGEVSDRYLDRDGWPVEYASTYPDGRVNTLVLAYGHPDGCDPNEGHKMKGTECAFATGRNLTREEFDDFLARLPPPPPGVPHVSLFGSRAFLSLPPHPWGYFWGDGSQTNFRLLHQEMAVASGWVDDRWLQIADSRGGLRNDNYAKTGNGEGSRYVGSVDALGWIAQVLANDEGGLTEVRYGEHLVARYRYERGDRELSDVRFELLDARDGRRLLDSRALPVTAAPPLFSALGGAVESVDDELFAVVSHDLGMRRGARYALLPLLHEGPVWRTVLVHGPPGGPQLRSRVHYTDDRLRIEFLFSGSYYGGRYADLVVEAPRRGPGEIGVTWPRDVALPLLDAGTSPVR